MTCIQRSHRLEIRRGGRGGPPEGPSQIMWIVRLALRRPYTFVVMALLLLVAGYRTVRTMPTDIFPSVDVPVISVVWSYAGLPAQQMEQQITQFSEYTIAGNVAGIKSLESDSFDGTSVIRVFLHPGADVPSAMATITAMSQGILRRMPPGTSPPLILRYSASSVPIVQLAFKSDTLSEAEIFDHVNQRVRTMLSVIPGTRFPLPSGGKARQISVDLDLGALRAQGLSPTDVGQAITAQNLTLPTGSAKIGEREYRVTLNSSPEAIAALNDVPVRSAGGRTVFVRDVAHVHDGFAAQVSFARQDERRAVVLSVLKTGEASTTEVARRVKELLPAVRASAPPGLEVELLADQSVFVTEAIDGLLLEGLVAAFLTATTVLLFLGSWRSTLVVVVSIPLSVTAALLGLRALGHTANTMTLGGLSLAVGILVDDATVEVENVHRHLAMGKPLDRAILDGARQIAVPAFVASLSIGLVFVSLAFLDGPARFLFLPMGLAVGFAVMASYALSRTLVPTMVLFLLRDERRGGASRGPLGRAQRAFEGAFRRLEAGYAGLLAGALSRRGRVCLGFGAVAAAAAALSPFVGRDFFPQVDAGQIRLHVTAPPGTRLEETERHFSAVEATIKRVIPEAERGTILDQVGVQQAYTLAITDSANVSTSDGEVLVTLKPGRSKKTAEYVAALRRELGREHPSLGFYFQPADIVTQILNFGLPSPVDVQVSGFKRDATLAAARQIARELAAVPGAADVRLHQIVDAPRLHVEVDRQRALEVGLTQRDVAGDLLLVSSSSGQTTPTFFTDPKTGFAYPVSVQVPDYQVDSLDALTTLPLRAPAGTQLLGDLAAIERRTTPVFVTHKNVQPTYNVRADVQDADLGSVAARAQAIVEAARAKLPPGSTVELRGQAASMREGFAGLGLGLLVAALLVYALMVVNFQSWLDPLVILAALPGSLAGLVFSLFATQTSFNIPSLMGAILSVGVATMNSILVVTFARERRAAGLGAREAALEAGRVRLRPVLMTALAMGAGMLPMSLGLGEGGEQNAALGRAVLGGLFGATLATLFFVPVVYSALGARARPRRETPDLKPHPEAPPAQWAEAAE
ncbi:MAG TPA: efflux RND transporter permease subunit [Polyangiaceae bacterium]|nr:efflux RND transporter permease subunit [Polyangiaceae bacterium]